MEPRIQYAKTNDGVSIAYCALGDGRALVWLPALPYSHISLAWQRVPFYQLLARTLATAGRQLVLFDPRGLGSSTREPATISLDAFVSDLEAVVDALHLEHFDLLAPTISAPVGIVYAARHPERLQHLVLVSPVPRYADLAESPLYRAVWSLRAEHTEDWVALTLSSAHIISGWIWDADAQAHAELLRAAVTPETARRIWAAMDQFDATGLLGQIGVPTLVTEMPTTDHLIPVKLVRATAAEIPGAQLAVTSDTAAAMAAAGEFLGTVVSGAGMVRAESNLSGLVTILFTDLAASTALTQRLGDAKAQELVRAHNAIVREALQSHGGTEIKHTGDGIMASFSTASGALECALAIQRGVAGRGDDNLRVHIGLNAGEPVAEEQDLFGTSVQLARRICDHAEAGQILASNVVRELAAGKGFLFADIGEVVPKGFEEPVRLYEVRWRD